MLDHINYQLQWNSRVCLQSTWTKSSSKYDRHVAFGKHHLKIAYPPQLPIFFFDMPLYRQIFYWAAWVTCMSTLSVSHLRVHQPSHQDTRPQKNFHRPRSQLHTGKYYTLQSLPQMLPYLYRRNWAKSQASVWSTFRAIPFSRTHFYLTRSYKYCVFQRFFSTLKKGYTPETSVLLDDFDTPW